MINRTAKTGIGVVVILLVGCSQRGSGIPNAELKALERGDRFELLSLDPEPVAL